MENTKYMSAAVLCGLKFKTPSFVGVIFLLSFIMIFSSPSLAACPIKCLGSDVDFCPECAYTFEVWSGAEHVCVIGIKNLVGREVACESYYEWGDCEGSSTICKEEACASTGEEWEGKDCYVIDGCFNVLSCSEFSSQGKWDPDDGRCVLPNEDPSDYRELKYIADTNGIYRHCGDQEGYKEGDGKCEAALGADECCDEVAPGTENVLCNGEKGRCKNDCTWEKYSEICQESDGGKNYETSGDCSDDIGVYQDYCKDDFTLIEYYCLDNSCISEEVDCRSALGTSYAYCEDGECKSATPPSTPQWKECTSTTLEEKVYSAGSWYICCYISGEYKWVSGVVCPNGGGNGGGGGGVICTNECYPENTVDYRCSGNVVQQRICGDYDDDPCLEWSSWNDYQDCDSLDGCSQDGSEIRDYYCSNGNCEYITVEYCQDTCSDSDNGINLTVEGTVIDYNLCSAGDTSCPSSSYTDYCIDERTLREYYCIGSDYAYIDKYVGNGYICKNGKAVEAVKIEAIPSFSINANDVYSFKVTVKNLLSESREITIYVPEVYNSTSRVQKYDSIIEEYSYQGNDIRGDTLIFSPNEEKEFEVIVRTPADIPKDIYRIKFAVNSTKPGENKGVYDEVNVTMNLGVILVPIKINARTYDVEGNPVPNVLVKGFVCPVYVEYCDEGSAMFKNETYADASGDFFILINAFLELGKKYKVSVVTEKGYSEAVIET